MENSLQKRCRKILISFSEVNNFKAYLFTDMLASFGGVKVKVNVVLMEIYLMSSVQLPSLGQARAISVCPSILASRKKFAMLFKLCKQERL